MYHWALCPKPLKVKSKGAAVTRSHSKKLLYSKKPRTEKFKNSFAYQGPKKWNNLPDTFRQMTTKEGYKLMVKGLLDGKLLKKEQNNNQNHSIMD